jgi:hypothetical protein
MGGVEGARLIAAGAVDGGRACGWGGVGAIAGVGTGTMGSGGMGSGGAGCMGCVVVRGAD